MTTREQLAAAHEILARFDISDPFGDSHITWVCLSCGSIAGALNEKDAAIYAEMFDDQEDVCCSGHSVVIFKR